VSFRRSKSALPTCPGTSFGASVMTSTSVMGLVAAPRVVVSVLRSRVGRAVRAVAPRRSRLGFDAAATESPPAESPKTVARSLEFMVEMSCGKCVASVEAACVTVPGVEAVVANLAQNTVRVVATAAASADDVVNAVVLAGYKCRLVGQGELDVFGEDLAQRLGTNLRTLRQSLAAVSEFKGSEYGHGDVAGVVRFVQVDETTCMVEGRLSGLAKHKKYKIAIHEFGDLTRGVSSVGEIWQAPVGDLGNVLADANGDAVVASRVVRGEIKVWDVIGRAVGIVPVECSETEKGVAAVLARSAGMGDNLKQQCACDGTVIWESAHDDFKPVGVKM
jgi:copper chaperone for superoxide dismutase